MCFSPPKKVQKIENVCSNNTDNQKLQDVNNLKSLSKDYPKEPWAITQTNEEIKPLTFNQKVKMQQITDFDEIPTK